MTTRTRHSPIAIRLLIAAGVATVALLAGAGGAAAAPAATATATSHCYLDVVNDWLQHQPNVVGTYPIACYTQAIQYLSSLPDVSQYSSAEDDIHRALLAAIHQERGNGPPGPSGGSGPSGGPASAGGGSPPTGGAGGPIHWLGAHLGPGNAQSIPLPLLVLGGLALLLLLAAFGAWLARRIQSRRVAPAPATAPRRR